MPGDPYASLFTNSVRLSADVAKAGPAKQSGKLGQRLGDTSDGRDNWDHHWKEREQIRITKFPAREYRRKLIVECLSLDCETDPRVLDIGSGMGDFLCDLNERYPNVPKLGVELSRTGVEIARDRLRNAIFVQRDLVAAGGDVPPEHSEFATHAVCSEVLEHVDDPVELLRNACGDMRKGCRLVATVPGGPLSAFDRHIGHRRHFSPDDLRQVLINAGYTVDFTASAGFPIFNLYRMLVILRGSRLVEDFKGEPGWLLRTTSRIFRSLFWLNLKRSPWGWQTIGIAHAR